MSREGADRLYFGLDRVYLSSTLPFNLCLFSVLLHVVEKHISLLVFKFLLFVSNPTLVLLLHTSVTSRGRGVRSDGVSFLVNDAMNI